MRETLPPVKSDIGTMSPDASCGLYPRKDKAVQPDPSPIAPQKRRERRYRTYKSVQKRVNSEEYLPHYRGDRLGIGTSESEAGVSLLGTRLL